MISKMNLKKCKYILENSVCRTSLKDCRCFVCTSHECILDICEMLKSHVGTRMVNLVLSDKISGGYMNGTAPRI